MGAIESLLLIWLLFGAVTAVVASNKGRSGCAWFFVGFLLGPIGLIISLVVSRDQESIEAEKIAGGEYRRCEHCAELIRSEAVKCRFCGSEVRPPDPPAPYEAPPPPIVPP